MKKILVVDNHAVILEIMTELLEKEGHQVLAAEDGLSALVILESYKPDVMFIDLVMPNIDGRKLCRIIRSRPEFKNVYLIILSAIAAEAEGRADFCEYGADACIAKGPFSKMSRHVLTALEQSDLGREGPAEKIIGLKDVYKREITKELLDNRRHFEIILANMVEGIFELTHEAKIVYANHVGLSFTKIPEEKLLASNFTELFDEPHRKRVKELLEVSGDAPREILEDSPVLLKGKELSINILPVRDNEHGSFIVIMRDISERRRMEARMRQAQKIEAIVTLAGGVAHEFNNALMAISGNIELLQMDLQPDEELHEKYIKPIKASVKNITGLINQLLAYAKGGRYQPKKLFLNDLVEETLPLIRHTIHPYIRVETDLSPDIAQVEADITQMQIVFSSVMANAAEALEGRGRIRIRTRNEEIDEEFAKIHPELKPGSYVCLSVEDEGKGMDEETKSRIFDPFFTTKFQGRGLGMAAVFGMIRSHNGWITVHSELGKSTAVHIYLPAI